MTLRNNLSGFRKNLPEAVWYLGCFLFLLTWYTQIHPLTVYDADDWTYIAFVREAKPLWGAWNPARVLPEILMPLCCSAAVYVLMPIVGDYLLSITIMSALVMSVSILVYLYCFGRMVKRLFALSSAGMITVSALFFLLHYLVLRNDMAENIHMFYCGDLTCHYYYLVPSLLNASIVMCIIGNPRFDSFLQKGHPLVRGIFFVAVYYAIFSNLPSSGILAAYAGCRLLLGMIGLCRKKTGFKQFFKEHWFFLAVLLLWFLSAIYELGGGRASAAPQKGLIGLLYIVWDGFKTVLRMLVHSNSNFRKCAIGLVVITGGLLIFTRKKDPNVKPFWQLLVTVIITALAMFVYTLVLCAQVEVSSITRSEFLFGLFFYGFLILGFSFAYLVRKFPKLLLVAPLALCVLVSCINTSGKTFADSAGLGVDIQSCMAVSNDLLEQVLAADRAGQTEMTLYVPVAPYDGNWPHADFLGGRMSGSLYEHGMISYPIRITIEPTEEMNEKYNILTRE